MSMPTQRSAVPEWFDADQVELIGKVCTTCQCVFFPPTVDHCRNPMCEGDNLESHRLATHGRVWSWTRNHYKPPAPYVATEPFEPYTVLAVELADDGLVVLGQLSPLSVPAEVGDHVSLRSETLLEDEEGIQLVWRWAVDGGHSSEVQQ